MSRWVNWRPNYQQSKHKEQFGLSDSDFQHETLLRRRRMSSPPNYSESRSRGQNRNSDTYQSSRRQRSSSRNPPSREHTTSFRTRSTSKSKARGSSRNSAMNNIPHQQFIPLGRQNSTSSIGAGRYVRSTSRGRVNPSATSTTPRESIKETTPKASNSRVPTSNSQAFPQTSTKRIRSSTMSSPHASKRLRRSKSPFYSTTDNHNNSIQQQITESTHDIPQEPKVETLTRNSSETNPSNSSTLTRNSSETNASNSSITHTNHSIDLQKEIDSIEASLKRVTEEQKKLQKDIDKFKMQLDEKFFEESDLQIALSALKKRQKLRLQRDNSTNYNTMHEVGSSSSDAVSPKNKDNRKTVFDDRKRKRPVGPPSIVDDEDDGSGDEVEILDPEVGRRQFHLKSPHHHFGEHPPAVVEPICIKPEDEKTAFQDNFWNKTLDAKLLFRPRVNRIKDQSAKKIRHLAFNPQKLDVFVTSADDGGLMLWNYARRWNTVTPIINFDAASFRETNQCAESIAWSPDGHRLAIAFRDNIKVKGEENGHAEFCVAQLHEQRMTESTQPRILDSKYITRKRTTMYSKGISAIDWLPSGHGEHVSSRKLVTTGSNHTVLLWSENIDAPPPRKSRQTIAYSTDYLFQVLHREHKSEVKAICPHSSCDRLYTGGFDGVVLEYDLNQIKTRVVLERRKPSISKINSILEHPHNSYLLLVSSVEQSSHNLLLHDLRANYKEAVMKFTWLKEPDTKSMSQYVIPRWSPAGMHISCGSNNGVVNIWDVRVRRSSTSLTLPHQSIAIHNKQVFHATWHPQHNAVVSVSSDRYLGITTFS